MKKGTIIAIVIGILVVLAIVQTFQVMDLKKAVSGASVSSPSVSGASSPVSAPKPSAAPTMVGGC